jgi:hypothetical protein
MRHRELNDPGRTEHGVELSQRARVRAGDHDEFGVLFSEHARAVRNHAFRLAATLPGATLVPHATNVAGRAGIGIMWTSKTARQVCKNEWIFDKTTLRFIGEKTYDPGTGRLTGESAIIRQAFTAKAGQLP